MLRRGLFFVGLLVFATAGTCLAQTSSASEPPPSSLTVSTAPSSPQESSTWAWLFDGSSRKVTAGDPELSSSLWQHTWGFASFDVIPVGNKMAPNGVPYDPIFSIDLLLNIALTDDRSFYIFGISRFWAQKPGEGITNSKQGSFDFSKRQYDLDAGLAWNFYTRFEARAYLYSYNNLNRGTSNEKPRGYKDGFGVECRYYMPSTDFDAGLYRYLAIGYLPTKELVAMDGAPFKPSFYAVANLAYDFIPERYYVYANLDFITERTFRPKLLIVDPGLAFRPLDCAPCLEFRVGTENTIDLEIGYTRTFLYGSARIVW